MSGCKQCEAHRELALAAVSGFNAAHGQILRIWRSRVDMYRRSTRLALFAAAVYSLAAGLMLAELPWLAVLAGAFAASEAVAWRQYGKARDVAEQCVRVLEGEES